MKSMEVIYFIAKAYNQGKEMRFQCCLILGSKLPLIRSALGQVILNNLGFLLSSLLFLYTVYKYFWASLDHIFGYVDV